MMYDARDAAPRSASARATPARERGEGVNRLNFDGEDVRGALDRLAFSNAVNQVTGAFSEALDGSEEIGTTRPRRRKRWRGFRRRSTRVSGIR